MIFYARHRVAFDGAEESPWNVPRGDRPQECQFWRVRTAIDDAAKFVIEGLDDILRSDFHDVHLPDLDVATH